MKDIKKVPVCFNVADPDQALMHAWVCKRANRSGYLKRLIQRDMEGERLERPINREIPVQHNEDINVAGFI